MPNEHQQPLGFPVQQLWVGWLANYQDDLIQEEKEADQRGCLTLACCVPCRREQIWSWEHTKEMAEKVELLHSGGVNQPDRLGLGRGRFPRPGILSRSNLVLASLLNLREKKVNYGGFYLIFLVYLMPITANFVPQFTIACLPYSGGF